MTNTCTYLLLTLGQRTLKARRVSETPGWEILCCRGCVLLPPALSPTAHLASPDLQQESYSSLPTSDSRKGRAKHRLLTFLANLPPRLRLLPLGVFEQTVPSSGKHPAHSAALIWSFLSPSCTGHQPIPSLPVPALRLPRAFNLRPCLSPRSRVSVQPPPSGFEAATCVLLLIPLDHAGHPSGSQP